jgi:hypothetical protein
MKIYFNGDSYVSGAELLAPATQGFAAKLSAKFGATIINQAENGSSNNLIIRKLTLFLDQCKQANTFPDLVVIGWSEFIREEWFVNETYKPVSFTGPVSRSYDPDSFDYWKNNMSRNPHFTHQMCKFYNRAIYNLHRELQHLTIPHLFFNAIYPLNQLESVREDFAKNDPIRKFNWKNSYFHPYDNHEMTWRGWALKNNYKPVSPGFLHFREDCQIDWAEIIYNYIKEKNIV